jgi:hypothetical protein
MTKAEGRRQRAEGSGQGAKSREQTEEERSLYRENTLFGLIGLPRHLCNTTVTPL